MIECHFEGYQVLWLNTSEMSFLKEVIILLASLVTYIKVDENESEIY